MSYADSILPEFDQEMAGTRKVLERIPEDRMDWQAHPKSRTIGWNANHLAEMPGWVAGVLQGPSWDVAPAVGEHYRSPDLKTRREVLELFDRNVAAAREAIQAFRDEETLTQPWSLLRAGEPIFTAPKGTVIRSLVLNHNVHHRAILCVYLRLNDIPVPGLYGPSGDD